MNVQGREVVQGVDISRWQGAPDYRAFDLDFAWIKATGGDGGLYRDQQFTRNSAWPKPWGPYHFAGRGTPASEANWFCDVIMGSQWAQLPQNMKLPPVLDWEPTVAVPNSGRWVLTFLGIVEQRTGVRPMIYTGAYVALDRVAELQRFDLWLAAYLPQPIPCAPWGLGWKVWQFTSSANVRGIVGGVDSDYADRAWFDSILGGTAPHPPPVPQPDPVPAPAPTPKDDDMPPSPFVLGDSPDQYYIVGNQAVHIPNLTARSVMITTGVIADYVPKGPNDPPAVDGNCHYIDGGVITAIRAAFPTIT